MKQKAIATLILFFLPSFACGESFEIQCNEVLEITLESSRAYDNPYREIELDLQLTDPAGQEKIIPGYWDGDDRWKVRLSCPNAGKYTFRTICSDQDNDGLGGKTGSISIKPYDGPNPLLKHGALKIGGTKNIVHADGTPFL